MKYLLCIFFFLYTCPTKAQTSSVRIHLDIIPELKDIFIGQEISIIQFTNNKGIQKFNFNDDILLDSLQGDSVNFFISCYINHPTLEKSFSVETSTFALSKNAITDIKILFPKDCNFNKHALNNTCPKCKRNDETVPIIYGLIMPIYNAAGDLVNNLPSKYKAGGCIISDCDPSWYCERDKLEF